MKIKESFSERFYSAVVVLILLLFGLMILIPLVNVVSGSFSDPMALLKGDVFLLPKGFTTSMYEKVFINPDIWPAYLNTIKYTIISIVVSVILTACAAYPLSRKDFFGKNVIMGLFAFTMFFNGGMIPTFLIVKEVGLLDSMWSLIFPSAISTYNLIIMRSFYQNTIPDEIVESAQIDGCNDLNIFIKMIVPLSKPILAVMVLFYGVWQWNSWFPSLLYISDRIKYPLQMILREILIQGETSAMSGGATDQEVIGDGLKYATMVVATFPIMCLYPFLQKYFVKGAMIGAVKG